MLKKTVVALGFAGAVTAAPAHAFLLNWFLDPDAGGAAPKTLINEFLDLVGPSYVNSTTPVAGNFTFNEFGAVAVTGHDGNVQIPFPGVPPVGGLASLFQINGNATLGGTVTYTGGTINVYSNNPNQFATATGIYGANTGVLIATFTPVTGVGNIDPTGIPNGQQTISAKATFLAPGYFFAPDGFTDLSAVLGVGGLIFGFATTNASYVSNPTALQVTELVGDFAGQAPASFTNCLPGQTAPSAPCTGVDGTGRFIISNNGQFRLSVPEPGGLALVGLSLILVGFARRRLS